MYIKAISKAVRLRSKIPILKHQVEGWHPGCWVVPVDPKNVPKHSFNKEKLRLSGVQV